MSKPDLIHEFEAGGKTVTVPHGVHRAEEGGHAGLIDSLKNRLSNALRAIEFGAGAILSVAGKWAVPVGVVLGGVGIGLAVANEMVNELASSSVAMQVFGAAFGAATGAPSGAVLGGLMAGVAGSVALGAGEIMRSNAQEHTTSPVLTEAMVRVSNWRIVKDADPEPDPYAYR